MKSYWIHITNDCNLQCKYCYQPNKNIKKLTIENAKKIIQQIKMTLEDSKIVFLGGEPLLNFDIIKFIIDDLSEIKGRNFEYSFTTNLTLLTEEMLHLFRYSFDADRNYNDIVEAKNHILKLKQFDFNQAIFPNVQIRFQEEHLNVFEDINLLNEHLTYEGSSLFTPFYKVKEIKIGNI